MRGVKSTWKFLTLSSRHVGHVYLAKFHQLVCLGFRNDSVNGCCFALLIRLFRKSFMQTITHLQLSSNNVLNIEWEEEQKPGRKFLARARLFSNSFTPFARSETIPTTCTISLDTILFYLSDRTQPFVVRATRNLFSDARYLISYRVPHLSFNFPNDSPHFHFRGIFYAPFLISEK